MATLAIIGRSVAVNASPTGCGRRKSRRGPRATAGVVAIVSVIERRPGRGRAGDVGHRQLGPPQLHDERQRAGGQRRHDRPRCAVHVRASPLGTRDTLVTVIGGVSFCASVLVVRSADDGAC